MMREILFRGKRVDNGEWVKGHLVVENTMIGVEKYSTYRIVDEYCEYDEDGSPVRHGGIDYCVDENTVGQYVGLIDKNGTKIFEGDKVRGIFRFGISVEGVCAFQESAFGIKYTSFDVERFAPFCCMHEFEWEVVTE